MSHFGSRRNWKNALSAKLALGLLFVAVVLFGWSVFGFWDKLLETNRNKKAAESRLLELREQKEKFSVDLEKLNTESGVEASIREKFGYGREGEGLIVLIEDEAVVGEADQNLSRGFWFFIKNLFK